MQLAPAIHPNGANIDAAATEPITHAVCVRLQMLVTRGDCVWEVPGSSRVRDGSQCTGHDHRPGL